MTCNGCYNSFSLLRPEKGCPSCGFSYCPKCLGFKVYLPRLKSENKVCHKCKKASMSNNDGKNKDYSPPDVFFRRMEDGSGKPDSKQSVHALSNPIDDQMRERLNKLKEKDITDAEIGERLQKVKGELPITSDTELHARLAKLRGIPVIDSKPSMMKKDLRTEQEQVEDLMKQYLENTAIDCKYKDEFDSVINDMEARLHKLKNANTTQEASGSSSICPSDVPAQSYESDDQDEEESIKKIIEKLKTEALQEKEGIAPSTSDELPFCEICNEDAKMRCLGCKYLFCKRCFIDHKDDDDGCNKYELYQPPNSE